METMSHQAPRLLFLCCLALACVLLVRAQDDHTIESISGEDITTERTDLEGNIQSGELTRDSTSNPVFSDTAGTTWDVSENKLVTEPFSSTDSSPGWTNPETTTLAYHSETTQDSKQNDSAFHFTSELTSPTVKVAHPTQPVFTDEIPTENLDKEWANDEDCVLVYVECVEPVHCRGHGKIDCSQQEKSTWFEADYNSSIIDQLLPREPRLRRSSNSKVPGVKKRFNPSKGQSQGSPNNQDEDYSSGVSCWTEETLLCSSKLNLNNCRGVGHCDANPSDVTSSSLAEWEIAVISVLTLAGVLLVGLLVYVIYGACMIKPRK